MPSVSPANDDETVTAVVSTLLTLALLLDVARLAGGPGRLMRFHGAVVTRNRY